MDERSVTQLPLDQDVSSVVVFGRWFITSGVIGGMVGRCGRFVDLCIGALLTPKEFSSSVLTLFYLD